ncbi:recombinase family protein [Kribbella italica]|uniref:Rhamnogalacturonyl hydrolase YesR n=1 Tax=Kribbella italica TaxID=1540520 RepID=A0A7W9JCY2_9ACTN|nr:recombinase family protein [Kribbella italica]MBB5839675.1 rhamnogalacturonyl hydrolase YesR [Kribbella italica]
MSPRPTLLGYVRADALSCAEELAAATDALVAYATTEGFTLGTVYTERDAAQSAAFSALLDEAKRTDVRAVVVPTLQHVGAVGSPGAAQHLEFHQAQTWAASPR